MEDVIAIFLYQPGEATISDILIRTCIQIHSISISSIAVIKRKGSGAIFLTLVYRVDP